MGWNQGSPRKWKKKFKGHSLSRILQSKAGFSGCTKCPLNTKSIRVPPYVPKYAEILLVGQAPGKDEVDRPFTGRSGTLLDEILEVAGIDRETVAIANVCNCRPFDKNDEDRPPNKKEIACCMSQLESITTKINPRLIVVIGNIAKSWYLPDLTKGIKEVRGHLFEYKNSRVLPIIHPASVLRSGSNTDFNLIIRDLKDAVDKINGTYTSLLNRVKVNWVTTHEEMEKLISIVPSFPAVAYDIEAGSLETWDPNAGILTYAVAGHSGEGWVVPMCHPETEWYGDEEETIYWHDALYRLLKACRVVVCHYAFYDILYTSFFLSKYLPEKLKIGKMIVDGEQLEDTWVLYFLQNYPTELKLKIISQCRGYPDWDSEMWNKYLAPLPKKNRTFDKIPLKILGTYNVFDGVATIDLRNDCISSMLTTDLGKHHYLLWKNLMQKMLVEFLHSIAAGINVDLDQWLQTRKEFVELRTTRLTDMYRLPQTLSYILKNRNLVGKGMSIRDMAVEYKEVTLPDGTTMDSPERNKKVLNTQSSQQMSDLIFRHSRVPIIEMGKTGPSLDSRVMMDLQGQYWLLASQVPDIPRKSDKMINDFGLTMFLTLDDSSCGIYHKTRKFLREKKDPLRSDYVSLNCAVARHVMLTRQIEKMISSYIDPFPRRVAPDGFYHPDLNITGTVTGRLASWLHTIPWDDRIKRIFRTKFSPDAKEKRYRTKKQGKIIGADYGQIEVRITAVFADDGRNNSALLNIFKTKEDLHRIVAASMLGKEPKDVTVAERRWCKQPHFSRLYMANPENVAKQIWRPGLSHSDLVKRVEIAFDNYNARFPEVAEFWGRVAKLFAAHGVVAPLTYLQNQLVPLYSDNPIDYYIFTPLHRAMRMEKGLTKWDIKVRPVNWPTQSTAADMCSFAAVRISNELRTKGYESHVIGTVHDAIYIDVHPEETMDVVRLTYDVMEDRSVYPWCNCPLVADLGIGDSFGHMDEIDREGNIKHIPYVKGMRTDRKGNFVEI